MEEHRPRIAIVEDHLMLAELFAQQCRRQLGYIVASISTTGLAGVAAARECRPDVVLLDLGLPDLEPLDLIRLMRAAVLRTKLVAVTSQCNPATVQLIYDSGLDGYVDKTSSRPSVLREAIEKVLGGQRSFPGWFREALAAIRGGPHSFVNVLNKRERRVLALIGLAWSDERVAAEMKFSVHSAHGYRTRLMRKLDLHSTPELIRYAVENGFTRYPAAEGLHRSLGYREPGAAGTGD